MDKDEVISYVRETCQMVARGHVYLDDAMEKAGVPGHMRDAVCHGAIHGVNTLGFLQLIGER